MELEPIVSVKGLNFSYPKRDVLKDVDFELHKGEVVSLLGANGCGKSTLIRLILGLIKGKGEIKIAGRDLHTYSQKEMASHIAYIPQYHNVPFNYSVLDMVVMGRVFKLGLFASPSKNDFDIARTALKTIGIASLANRAFGELSGGQKQMVLLARALTQEAKTFIMDEPVSGLDYGNQMRLLELINELSSMGYTFLKTTHYPDHAILVSSRVVVMDEGHIIASGTSSEVITDAMMQDIYNIDAKIITYDDKQLCIPILKGQR
ncbi:ABC transporter ATP-binding protein [bacterium]|nr:ABC transporter ATP-binding protein [bacterium]MBU1883538.1 ABC transporter ATP-binding protein [bacterium]